MKKSLSKILARMAKDGDIETVAEIIEEMIEPETETPEAAAEEVDDEVAEVVEEVAEEPAAVVETPSGSTIVVDEATLGDILTRLDQIISLLTPAPAAADENPAEEVAEAVEEAMEAVAAEEEEAAEGILPEATSVEELAELVQEIIDPASEVIGAEEDECEEQEPEVISTGDALRAALCAVGPALAKMPKKQRQRVCADIAARLNGKAGRQGADTGIYAALAAARRKPAGNPADLGKRIMAARSANRPRN